MKRNPVLTVSLYYEFRTYKAIKVKAHKRFRNGKVVKVNSHYRRVWGRPVMDIEP